MGFFSEDMLPMLGVFEAETSELMTTLDSIASRVEQERKFSTEDVAELFRCAHTTKGSSAMMGLDSLSHLTHKVEDLFDLMRGNPEIAEGRVDDILDYLYAYSDFVKDELQRMSNDDFEPTDAGQLINEVSSYVSEISGIGNESSNSGEVSFQDGETGDVGTRDVNTATDDSGNGPVEPANDTPEELSVIASEAASVALGSSGKKIILENKPEHESAPSVTESANGGNAARTEEAVKTEDKTDSLEKAEIEKNSAAMTGTALKVSFKPDVPMVNARALVILKQLGGQVHVHSYVPNDLTNLEAAQAIAENGLIVVVDPPDADKAKQFLAKNSFIRRISVLDEIAPNTAASSNQKKETSGGTSGEDKFISLKWSNMRNLQDMAGEFLLQASRLKSLCAKLPEETELRGAVSGISRLVDDLVYQVDRMAMVSMSAMVPQLSRMVRDMCRSSGKQVSFEVHGGNIEIDRNLYNSISDPLLHIIRNAVDHGIEKPEVRLAAGKEARGKVSLSVENLGARVAFRVSDDGNGIDTDKVLAKAQKKGLLERPAEDYSRQDILNMVMTAGLSTSDEVTQYSGRGVGMDVVDAVVRDFNGRVEIESAPGEGTSITLFMPVAVTSVESLGFRIGPITYHMPLFNLSKVLTAEEAAEQISHFEGTALFTYKKRQIPVIDSHKLLSCQGENAFYIVCHSLNDEFVIGVDSVIGDVRCANKPLPSCLGSTWQNVCPIRNVAIMEDGSIGYALNAALLAALAQGREESFWREGSYEVLEPGDASLEVAPTADIPPYAFVFTLGQNWYAIPIDQVARLIPLGSFAQTPKPLPYLLGLTNYRNQSIALYDLVSSAGIEDESTYALIVEDELEEYEGFTISAAIGIRDLGNAILAEDQPAPHVFAAGWHTTVTIVDDPKEPPITLLARR